MKILIIDIETTGFLNQGGKICEIGIVQLDLESGIRKILYDKVFNPILPADDLAKTWIVEKGYMTVEEIMDGLVLTDREKSRIQDIIDLHPEGVTAFNRSFDVDFLKANGIQFGKLLPCPMLKSTPICKLPGKFNSYKWPKAEEAFRHFFPESNYVELHRGADDAFHEAAIVYELHKMGKFLD